MYNLISHELVSFLDGYTALDISPDGKSILLKVNKWKTGSLFILDLAQPEKINLLQENVDDAAWLGDSGWIGFISIVNGKRQVFLVHSDGSDLTQVTNSSIGAVTLEPVFNDGVFWGEGTVDANGTRNIRNFKWTKLDGTETEVTNFYAALPLSDDKLLIEKHPNSAADFSQFWISSRDGNIVAELPHEYRPVDEIDPPSPYRLLSPDGIWMLVSKIEKISDEQFTETYYLFDTTTSEIQALPNLYYSSNRAIKLCRIRKYFWVD